MLEYLSDISITEAAGRAALILAAIGVFVQIAPIKWNPLSWIAKKLGKAMNGEWQRQMDERMDKFESKIDKLEANMEESDAKMNRTKILRFGDEILRGQKHSKDHFDEILQSITEYDIYCENNPNFKNHMTDIVSKQIMATYEKCREENSFLF